MHTDLIEMFFCSVEVRRRTPQERSPTGLRGLLSVKVAIFSCQLNINLFTWLVNEAPVSFLNEISGNQFSRENEHFKRKGQLKFT